MNRPVTLRNLLESEYLPAGEWADAANVRQRLGRVLDQFEEYLGEPPTLDDLSERVIALWVRELLSGDLSAVTVHDYVARLRAFWTWCHKAGHIDRPPRLGSIRNFSRKPRKWTIDEVRKLTKAVHKLAGDVAGLPAAAWWDALHYVAWDTGEPRATLLQMQWDWFDSEAGAIIVPAAARWSGLHEVAHYLEPETIERLRAIREPARSLIFPYPHSRPKFYRDHDRLLQQAGIRVGRKETALRRLDAPFASRRVMTHKRRDATKKRRVVPLSPDDCQTLVDFAEWYVSCRSISRLYANQLRARARKLQQFVDRQAVRDVLSEANVNAFLAAIEEEYKPATVRGYRVDLLTLWGAAADEDLVPYPLRRRIRRKRMPAQIIDCYTVAEAEAMLAAAGQLEGCYRNAVPRAAYWNAAIRLAWDTGLRRGDVWAFESRNVDAAGNWRCVQQKTGNLAGGRLHPSTLAALQRIDRPRPCEWVANERKFVGEFEQVRDCAGVTRGSWKWLRRSSGSYVEAQQIGAGHRHLGQTSQGIFSKHYDARLASQTVVMPPELQLNTLAR